jgi:CrcB protein
MNELAWVALGSGLGAVARFGFGEWLLRRDFPYRLVATLTVNLSGCLAAGALAGSLEGPGSIQSLLVPGFLGSYTTVSAFSLETVGLWRARRRRAAAAYVLVSIVGGLLLALLGGWAVSGLGS